MTFLSEIIVLNLSPFTKPTILQWPACEERKVYQGKEHDIIRLGRIGNDGEARKEMTARKG